MRFLRSGNACNPATALGSKTRKTTHTGKNGSARNVRKWHGHVTWAMSRIQDLDVGREDDEVVMIGLMVTESASRQFEAWQLRRRICVRDIEERRC